MYSDPHGETFAAKIVMAHISGKKQKVLKSVSSPIICIIVIINGSYIEDRSFFETSDLDLETNFET